MTTNYENQTIQRLGGNGDIEQTPPARRAREVEIFSQICRHTLAILYLWAELRLGYKPEKLQIKE